MYYHSSLTASAREMNSLAPANYDEFSASRRRKRAVQESVAAVSAAEAAAVATAGPAEDAFVGAAKAHGAVLAVIALQFVCLLFELVHPSLASWTVVFGARPGLAGLALVLSQLLPPVLSALRAALAYFVLGLWLASFAEVALFLQSCWASRGARGFAGLAMAVLERPLRAADAMAVLLLGSALLFAVGPRALGWITSPTAPSFSLLTRTPLSHRSGPGAAAAAALPARGGPGAAAAR